MNSSKGTVLDRYKCRGCGGSGHHHPFSIRAWVGGRENRFHFSHTCRACGGTGNRPVADVVAEMYEERVKTLPASRNGRSQTIVPRGTSTVV